MPSDKSQKLGDQGEIPLRAATRGHAKLDLNANHDQLPRLRSMLHRARTRSCKRINRTILLTRMESFRQQVRSCKS